MAQDYLQEILKQIGRDDRRMSNQIWKQEQKHCLCLGKERQELRWQAVDQATAEIKGSQCQQGKSVYIPMRAKGL